MTGTVFVASTLDGYIARPDGGIDWLNEIPGADPNESYGFVEFLESVDAMVMGRKTWDQVQSFDQWAYGAKPVFVLTHRELGTSRHAEAQVEAIDGSPLQVAERLAGRGFRHIYVDGGDVIHQFIAAGLVDRLVVTWIPILIGRGIPLFGDIDADIPFDLQNVRSYAGGLVMTEYVRRTEGSGGENPPQS